MIRHLLIAGSLALGLVTTAPEEYTENLGKNLPEAKIEGFTQSPAASFEELTGRVILIEFFAYW